MIVGDNDGVEHFTTFAEAMAAAKKCMALIKKARVHTCAWQENDTTIETPTLREWVANDGLVHWSIDIMVGPLMLFEVLVTMWGEDQMCYNWSAPCCGDPETVIDCCLGARQVDVEGGEIWSWMWQSSDRVIEAFINSYGRGLTQTI